MIRLAEALVALPAFLAIYAYIAYPLVLWIISRVNSQRFPHSALHLPPVSIVVPAYNEEGQIAGAIGACWCDNLWQGRTGPVAASRPGGGGPTSDSLQHPAPAAYSQSPISLIHRALVKTSRLGREILRNVPDRREES